MKGTSSIGLDKVKSSSKSLKSLIFISIVSCLFILSLLILEAHEDPYITASLSLDGSSEKGSDLFRMNCVGCHGISAQGLVGPDLNEVTNEISDKRIINQVVKGLTPPMPSFEMDTQSMADLLSYLHSLNT